MARLVSSPFRDVAFGQSSFQSAREPWVTSTTASNSPNSSKVALKFPWMDM